MSKAIITESKLTAIADAIRAKGGTSANLTPDGMATAIAAIPTGSSAEWNPPSGWPNLRTILRNDTVATYAHKIAILFNVNFSSYTPPSNCYARYNDSGSTIASGAHTFDPTQDIIAADGSRFRWAIVYFDNNAATVKGLSLAHKGVWLCSIESDYYVRSGGDYMLYDSETLVCFEANVKASSTNMNSAFANCYSLQTIIGTVDMDGVTTATDMFVYDNALGNIPNLTNISSLKTIKFPNASRSVAYGNSAFNLPAFTALPSFAAGNVASIPNVTATNLTSNIGTVDSGMYRESHYPAVFCVNKSFAFTGSTSYLNSQYAFTLATFDANGALSGGLFHSLPTVATAEAATFNSTAKGWFTPDQQDAIVDALDAKGWTLSW